MPRFLVERTLPIAGRTPAEFARLAATAVAVARELPIIWLHSYVAADTLFCIFDAPSVELVHEHARRWQLPIDRVVEVTAVIGPATAPP